MKIIDVAREAGLNRSTVRALYYEDWVRVDRESIEKLCQLFNCAIGDLFEFDADAVSPKDAPSDSG